MWSIKNQPSNSISCTDNALRLLVLAAGILYWGLQGTSSFSIWDCVLKGCFERGIFRRAKSHLKGIEDFNLEHWCPLAAPVNRTWWAWQFLCASMGSGRVPFSRVLPNTSRSRQVLSLCLELCSSRNKINTRMAVIVAFLLYSQLQLLYIYIYIYIYIVFYFYFTHIFDI